MKKLAATVLVAVAALFVAGAALADDQQIVFNVQNGSELTLGASTLTITIERDLITGDYTGTASTTFDFSSLELLGTRQVSAQLNQDMPTGIRLQVAMGLLDLDGSADVSNTATEGPAVVLSGLSLLNATGTITYTATVDENADLNSADFVAGDAGYIQFNRTITFTVTDAP